MAGWWKKSKEKMTPEEAVPGVISIAESILTAQLAAGFSKPHDAFSSIITNKLAMGYVFGLFDSIFQRFKILDPNNPARGLEVIETAYRKIFGEFGGNALFGMTKAMQDDPEFFKGRCIGGNELMDFLQNEVHPLGLNRIVILGLQQ